MEKRPADSVADGDSEAKKVKLDPECGRLLFCGSTNWEVAYKPGKLKDEFYYSKQNIYEPMLIAALKDVRIRHVGSCQDAGHIVVVDETGQAWSWGNNEYGQLGQGDTQNRRIPTRVEGTGPNGHNIVMVALGAKHTLLLTSLGQVLSCGDNTDGQCGVGEMKSKTVANSSRGKEELEINSIERVLKLTPINYVGPPIIKISAGIDFSFLLDIEGFPYTFGSQEFGKLGTGTDGAYNAAEAKVRMRYAGISEPFKLSRVYERDTKTKKTKPLQMVRIKSIAAGSHHCAMVDELQRVFTWGAGSYGRTGLNDVMDTHIPTWVSALDHPRGKIEEVYCGNLMTIMIGKVAGAIFLAGIVDSLKKEANMSPKQFFDFGEHGLRDVGFFRKGWIAIGDDGGVIVTNTGPCYGELGNGERFRTQGVPKKSKELEYAHIMKVGTGAQHSVFIMRDTDEEDLEELEEFEVLDQAEIEYKPTA